MAIGAMALYYQMLNHGTAGRVAANVYLIPGTVALLGWALLGERLTPLAVLGFAIASVGVFLVARHQPPTWGGVRPEGTVVIGPAEEPARLETFEGRNPRGGGRAGEGEGGDGERALLRPCDQCCGSLRCGTPPLPSNLPFRALHERETSRAPDGGQCRRVGHASGVFS